MAVVSQIVYVLFAYRDDLNRDVACQIIADYTILKQEKALRAQTADVTLDVIDKIYLDLGCLCVTSVYLKIVIVLGLWQFLPR